MREGVTGDCEEGGWWGKILPDREGDSEYSTESVELKALNEAFHGSEWNPG